MSVPVCLSQVRVLSKGWTNRAGFWHGSFLSYVLHHVLRKYRASKTISSCSCACLPMISRHNVVCKGAAVMLPLATRTVATCWLYSAGIRLADNPHCVRYAQFRKILWFFIGLSKFIVRSTHGSELRRAKISLRNVISWCTNTISQDLAVLQVNCT